MAQDKTDAMMKAAKALEELRSAVAQLGLHIRSAEKATTDLFAAIRRSSMPRPDMVCPDHGPMTMMMTKYGPLWKCYEGACDVMCWGGLTSTPANQETRDLRKACHEEFDKIWKSKRGHPIVGKMQRKEAYRWLIKMMKVSKAKAHIGMFSKEQCIQLLLLLGKDKDDVRFFM